jgi:hypothetical protein
MQLPSPFPRIETRGKGELEVQAGGLGLAGDVADRPCKREVSPADNNQHVAAQPSRLGLQPSGGMGVGEPGDPPRRGGLAHLAGGCWIDAGEPVVAPFALRGCESAPPPVRRQPLRRARLTG